MNRYKDFDACLSEAEAQPVRFTYGGEEFELPAELPAAIPLKAIRLQQRYGSEEDIPRGDLMDLALSVFGQENLDRLVAKNISISKLGDILRWVMAQYAGQDLDEGNPATPEAPGEK